MKAASKLDKDKLGLLITPQLQIEQKLLFSFKHEEDKGSSNICMGYVGESFIIIDAAWRLQI
jgi:hypothetical protein